MYLKELAASGFKSFASTTRFHFEPGITAIVGPNGSGKSNVVDALAWVLGEQGAKPLRGGNMADVIFAGGTRKAALGRAQVEVTIDNSSGRLPIAFSEVTIRRTMFRTGGSEYAINGQNVRLLDVQELLSDSGLGRQKHTIVGQGALDSVLTATPQERRSLIDEAAGISKYRARKKRALRKLEAMDTNLVRVADLVEDMRKRLRPLARQAKAAQQATEVRYAFAYASARLLAADLVDAQEVQTREARRLAELKTVIDAHDEKLALARTKLTELEDSQDRVRQERDALTARHRDATSLHERLASITEITAERINGLKYVPQPINADQVDRAQQLAEQAASDTRQASANLEQAEATHRCRVEACNKMQTEQRQIKGELDSIRSGLLRDQSRQEEAATTHKQAQARLYSAQEQSIHADQRLEDARNRLKDAQGRVTSAGTSQGESDSGNETTLRDQHRSAVEREQERRTALAETEKNERQASELAASLRAQRKAYESALRTRKPHDKKSGAKAELPKGPRLEDILEVERGWEEAIASLLAPLLTSRILTEEAFSAAIPSITQIHDTQGLSFSGYLAERPQPETNVQKPRPVEREVESVLPASDVIGRDPYSLSDLRFALRNCWVCETIEEAFQFLSFLEETRGQSAAKEALVATRTGILVGYGSVVWPGDKQASTLMLRAELAEVRTAEKNANSSLEQARADLLAARTALQEATENTAACRARLREDEERQAAQDKEKARLNALVDAAQADVNRASKEAELAKSKIAEAQANLIAATERLEQQVQDADPEALAKTQERYDEVSSRLQTAREEEREARVEVHLAKERFRSAESAQRNATSQAKAVREERRRGVERLERSTRTREQLDALLSRTRDGMARAEALVATTADLQAAKSREWEDLREQQREVARQIERHQSVQSKEQAELLQLEVANAQISSQVETLTEKAEDLIADYGADLGLRSPRLAAKYGEAGQPSDADPADAKSQSTGSLISAYGPHLPWDPNPNDSSEQENVATGVISVEAFTRPKARAELEKANQALRRLGVVNPLAVEEYEAASARYEFLQSQMEDLTKSKSDLLRLVKTIDAQVKTAFTEAFEDVNEQFRSTFAALFPNGEGRLELTEPDDPLTTGVEIYARPHGKRVTRLSLLSGGERSLAALAYLIAIFKARPSPFYVLDEVEAALDDTNLRRVLALLEELRKDSQLLIITHQKQTMEFADALYGVTMKDGVTAVMSHRMDAEASGPTDMLVQDSPGALGRKAMEEARR